VLRAAVGYFLCLLPLLRAFVCRCSRL